MAFSNPCVIKVKWRDRKDIRDKGVVNPVLQFLDPVQVVFDVIHSGYVRYATGRTCHGHGHPAAEKGADLGCLCLHLQRLKIMGDCKEIDIRRELVRRVSPISVGKGPELPRGYERIQFGLDFFQRGLLGLGLCCRNHIYVIERCQMIEPQDVGMHELSPFNDVPDYPSILRRPDLESIVHAHGRCVAVGSGADAADPLGNVPGIARVPSLEDQFKAPEQGAGCPGVLDLPALYLEIYPQMSLYTCEWVNSDPCHYFSPPSFLSFVLPDAAVPMAWAAIPTTVATPAMAPSLSAPASTPPRPGMVIPGSLS